MHGMNVKKNACVLQWVKVEFSLYMPWRHFMGI